MTLIRPDSAHLGESARELFHRAQQRAPWSARELIGTGRTELPDDAVEHAWRMASVGYYAEQAGLVAAAELAAQTEDLAFRMGLATAVADEARHSDAFYAYAVARGGQVDDCHDDAYLVELHTMLSSAGYLEKALLHTMLEGLAADEFLLLQRVFAGDPIAELYRRVRADENLHVAIGLDYLRRSYADPQEREEWDAHSIDWERRCLELADPAGVSQWVARLLDRSPEQVEQWIMRRHRARLRGAGLRLPEGR